MKKSFFNVISKMMFDEFADVPCNTAATRHIFKREYRRDISVVGEGCPCAGFVVDKNHPNGLEEHIVYSNALVVIRNHHTKKLITILVARPMQIKRYYDALGFVAPQRLLQLAYIHVLVGLNK